VAMNGLAVAVDDNGMCRAEFPLNAEFKHCGNYSAGAHVLPRARRHFLHTG
jgi:hypothetical protein